MNWLWYCLGWLLGVAVGWFWNELRNQRERVKLRAELATERARNAQTWGAYLELRIVGIFDVFRSPSDALLQMDMYLHEACEAAERWTPELEGASLADRINEIAKRSHTEQLKES